MHRLVYSWPEGHNLRHLKREVVTTLVDKRDEILPRIGEHLRKSKLRYKDAVQAIRERDKEEPIPKDLGDFILAAISIVIRKPILVVKPVIETTKDPNGRTTTVYNCKVEYLERLCLQRVAHFQVGRAFLTHIYAIYKIKT